MNMRFLFIVIDFIGSTKIQTNDYENGIPVTHNKISQLQRDTLFCPIYDKNLCDMILEKTAVNSGLNKIKILKKFAEKFTLLPEHLSEFERFYNDKYNLHNPSAMQSILDNYSSLYSIQFGNKNNKHIEWSNKDELIRQLYDHNCKNRFKIIDEALTFPHKWLKVLIEHRITYAVAQIPNCFLLAYLESKNIYDKIKECENDIDKWLECIEKIKNKGAVIANLELKLGQDANWKNKQLWKFYFHFLKENNMIEILDVYRKYTCLFISDKQAVEDYRNELDKFSSWNLSTTKYWMDTIKYEIDFGTLESAYRVLERALKAVIGKPFHFVVKDINYLYKKLQKFEKEMTEAEQLRNAAKVSNNEVKTSSKPVIYYQSSELQNFCFHQSFVQNVLKNANPLLLRKLYSSCKIFYSMRKAPLCYRLEITDLKKTHYCEESLFINTKDIDFAGLNNLHVYGVLDVKVVKNSKLVSQILPKFKYFNTRFITIRKQELTLAEFQMLLSKRVAQIYFRDVLINFNGKCISAKCFFDALKIVNAKLYYLQHVNVSQVICSSYNTHDLAKNWLPHAEIYQFEEIHFENQIFNVLDLQKFINYEALKNITLKNVTVKDENGSKMEKNQLEELIKAEVNPKNNVCIEIF